MRLNDGSMGVKVKNHVEDATPSKYLVAHQSTLLTVLSGGNAKPAMAALVMFGPRRAREDIEEPAR